MGKRNGTQLEKVDWQATKNRRNGPVNTPSAKTSGQRH